MSVGAVQSGLSRENEDFIRRRIEQGEFADRDAALNAGVELLRKKEQLAREREKLLAVLDEGIRQLENGEYTEYDEDGLREFFEDVKRRGRERLKQRGEPP